MKHYLMELIGAFFLTLAVAYTGNPVAIGLMFMALYYVGERVSGGYYNPALAVAGWLRGVLNVEDMLVYSGVEIIGAFLAVWFNRALTGETFVADSVVGNGSLAIACLVEILLTALLALVLLTCATSKEYKGSVVNGVVIGLTLAGLLYFQGMYNPAIAAGAYLGMLVSGDGVALSRDLLFISILSPLVGGALASFAFDHLYGRK